ncbi:hypothetical protein CSV60_13830 [Sporosarcina sp. P7]|nr:hypothetical protein CSV60_13830 [Sporosarcina sp. P7]
MNMFKFNSKSVGVASELVSVRGWKLQLADAFPWARLEPPRPLCSLRGLKALADPSGVAASFRFHPTQIVGRNRSLIAGSV